VPRVLIADDSPDVRQLVRITLRSQGWEVTEAESPAEALELAEREHPDAVVLDVVFEGHAEDGFAVCRRLRSVPAIRNVPVVLLTARTSAGARALADSAGATAYLAKPFRPMDLISTLRSVLDVPALSPALGLLLVDDQRLKPEALESALEEQRRLEDLDITQPLGEILVRQGAVSEIEVARALDRQRATPELAEPSPPIRVVIADDHLAVRDGLRALLAEEDGFEVVGIAPDGEEALALIRTRRPDVAILDHEMPRRTGLEVLSELRREALPTAVVIFSFDAGVRERALAGGAAAFLTKDAPPKVLAAAVRRAAGRPRPSRPPVASALAASHVAWRVVARQRRAALVMGILAVTYAGGFLIAEPFLGAGASLLAMGAAALAGALLGPEAGALWALLSSALTAFLWGVTGHERGEPVLTIGGNGVGVIALVGIGAGFGAMRLLRGRFDSRDRRVEALVESGLFVGAGGPQLLEIAADAARQVIRAEALLLYARLSDGSFAVVAASGAPDSLLGHRESAASGPFREAITGMRPRVLGEPESRSYIPRMRSAILLPVAPVGEDPEGVLVALSERRGGLNASDAATLSRFTPLLWLALKVARQQEWWSAATRRAHMSRSQEDRSPSRT